jgi:ribose transport system ATP-binding protein
VTALQDESIPGAAALVARGVSKTFGGERALDEMGITVARGEIMGLLGANGSGKSTFIKILAGYHDPDQGELEVNGQPVSLPISLRQRRAVGLEFVHQDLGLIPTLSVAENLCVTDVVAPKNKWFATTSEQVRKTKALLDQYNLAIPATAPVSTLRPVEAAMVAIVRAVEGLLTVTKELGHGGVLVLDEPTVFLPKDGAELLFQLVRDIARSGSSVIFVSHKLEEVLQLTNHVTVLRDGRVVYTAATAETDEATIVDKIVGRKLNQAHIQPPSAPVRERSVTVTNARGGRLQETSFEVNAGEIVGVTGLVGSGFEELPQILVGITPRREGTLTIGDKSYDLARQTPSRALRAGLALVPADRKRDGGVLTLSVSDNLMLPVLSRYQRGLFQRRRKMKLDAAARLDDFQVQPKNPTLEYGSLSGGNQQKVLLAKWLQMKPRLLVLHEPTQGVDVGARAQIHTLIRDVAAEGMAVICASSDYDQVALLCDRVLIFADGQLKHELTGGDVTNERITEHCYSSVTVNTVVPTD